MNGYESNRSHQTPHAAEFLFGREVGRILVPAELQSRDEDERHIDTTSDNTDARHLLLLSSTLRCGSEYYICSSTNYGTDYSRILCNNQFYYL